ncbi:MAG TPA: ATP-grasp domain-containing protein [Pyrinomonadaceae bacterium]|nr:ATP-grasp domain-containing protein [Pyrinomonadaceae bacterium]
MTEKRPLTVLCIASYEKGQEFMRECKRQGCRVLLLTLDKLRDADWPREAIDETFYVPEKFPLDSLIKATSYVAREREIDRIVPLDDFDVETAAALREHLRIPGMGDTTARYFRDKLAMRVKARDHDILVPEFVHVLNHARIREYVERVPPPWVLKPRSEASAVGIVKVKSADELWPTLEGLGDRQSFYLLEQFIPGDIFHVDSIVSEREVVFAAAHKYGQPPMAVAHEGGVFMTRTIARHSSDAQALEALNRDLIKTLGLVRGVTHTEFIKGHEDGRFYFLETASRVGGANIAEVVEAATGVNLWAEWAKIEIGGEQERYEVPPTREDYAGIVISLARQECPDTSAYDDPEIVWRLNKRHHVGLLVASHYPERVEDLLQQYIRRFYTDFFAMQPLPERPTS